jgi:GMP synthase (glutamine-hydrolysing)
MTFDVEKFVAEKIKELQNYLKEGKAIIACSGGVDSTTTAALTKKAIGDRLIAVFVDTGYLRKNESEKVKELLTNLGLNLRFVDARKEFYVALKDVIDPELKRKIIGEKFIRVFERVAKAESIEYLVQGTIAPDWIESGGGLRARIKTHHNVGGLPKDLKLKIVEPLRDLYKDEVRAVARYLKTPVSERQPYPGPGLAVRIVGEASEENAEIIREACAIVEEEIERAVEQGKMEKPWQYFAVLLPVKTVGVQGDIRAYGNTIAVRAVHSVDGMTASYSKIPDDILERISIRITNTLKDKVNRVVYDITNKPPGTIEWE